MNDVIIVGAGIIGLSIAFDYRTVEKNASSLTLGSQALKQAGPRQVCSLLKLKQNVQVQHGFLDDTVEAYIHLG